MRFEGRVAKSDLPQTGIGAELPLEADNPDICASLALDIVKFAGFVHRLDDAKAHVLDAWIEIDGRDSEWCATLARQENQGNEKCGARRDKRLKADCRTT